ncbi:MAG: hypothetical protein JWN40_3208, partial [Phycisphaerales bacterium]|nr:hypothetical protein [Phycisphaerales bacterium]
MTIACPQEETVQSADSLPAATLPRKPISEKRVLANRLNALRSTGPRTPAGKQRVSANALKHGLRASAAHLCPEESNHPAECSATYKTFEQELKEELQPKTVLQKTLFPQIATLAWRLRRLPHTEQEIFAHITNHRFPPPAPADPEPLDSEGPPSHDDAPPPSSILHLPSSSPSSSPPPPCQTLAQAFCSHDNANPFTLFNRYERSLQNAFLRLLRHYDHLKK